MQIQQVLLDAACFDHGAGRIEQMICSLIRHVARPQCMRSIWSARSVTTSGPPGRLASSTA
jgi:hypothetical protein